MTEAAPKDGSGSPKDAIGGKGPAKLWQIALALTIGAIGGYIFLQLRLPLAWMMGAMVFTTAAAIAGVPIRMAMKLRTTFLAILGVMLGSAFRPDIIDQLGQWIVSAVGIVAYVSLAGWLVYLYYRRFSGYDQATAYFAASPGGLSEMIMMGTAMGGDERIISLTHGARILLVVLTVPLFFRYFLGYEPPPRGVTGISILDMPYYDLMLLGLCAVIGAFLAKLARLPASLLVGPMLCSAAIHLAGLTSHAPPFELVTVAQVVIGSAIGCRFAGTKLALVRRTVGVTMISTAILLAVTLIFSVSLHLLTDLPTLDIVLAFSPGGLAEMSLVALAVGGDTAFVSSHHILRIIVVVLLAPLVFRLFVRRPALVTKPGQADD